MAAGVRFTKAEREFIAVAIGAAVSPTSSATKKDLALVDSITGKLDKAELGLPKKKSTGISIAAATEAFRGVLGNRLVLPPNPGPGWWAQMSRLLGDLGVTAGDCTTIAKVAGEKWRGYIKFDSLARQGAVLLAEAQLPLPINSRAPRMGSDLEEL